MEVVTHLDVLLDEVKGHSVLGAPGDDHVGVLLGRDAELLEGGLDQGGVLVQHILKVTPPLRNITENSPKQENIHDVCHLSEAKNSI